MAVSADDPHDLDRFVSAQADDYGRALAEIKAGRKRSHWMWYVFPQIDGLGFSSMSRRYSIKSLDEASDAGAGPGPSERVRELIRLNPEAAAGVLQRWIGQGGALG